MGFEQEINELEKYDTRSDYVIKNGNVPILFSAPHTINQEKIDGTIKFSEPYTKAISLYLNKYCGTYSIIKLKDNGQDSNRDNHDKYKEELIKLIKERNIKLVIDLHGAAKSRDFDVEFGTLNNLSADFSTIKELEEAFTENGIKEVTHNEPFKGGAITQYLYNLKDVDAIQVEINAKYRDKENIELLEKLIGCFMKFIKQYNDYTNR